MYIVPLLPLDGSVLFFLPYVFTSAIVGGTRFRTGEQILGLNSDLIYITQ